MKKNNNNNLPGLRRVTRTTTNPPEEPEPIMELTAINSSQYYYLNFSKNISINNSSKEENEKRYF
jgi:hypothetical protein